MSSAASGRGVIVKDHCVYSGSRSFKDVMAVILFQLYDSVWLAGR
jgi:hypothetical protein